MLLSLFGLGFVAGPIQPVNAELAVEVTYPSDETAVESTQQIFGNLISALMVPIAEKAALSDFQIFPNDLFESDVRGDVLLLSAVAAITYFVYKPFEPQLKRSLVECEPEDDNTLCEAPDIVDVVDIKPSDNELAKRP